MVSDPRRSVLRTRAKGRPHQSRNEPGGRRRRMRIRSDLPQHVGTWATISHILRDRSTRQGIARMQPVTLFADAVARLRGEEERL